MPRLILKCPYLKGGSASVNAGGYLRYIATRDGAQRIALTDTTRPATDKQQALIHDLLRDVPDAVSLHEYQDYEANPTIANASEFITCALEENPHLTGGSERYVRYIAERPRVEKLGTHGLFGPSDAPIVLSQVQQEVNAHTGNVWTPILSLRREDATRLGYDNAAAWQNLLRMRAVEIATAMKIAPEHFHWYAAFHDEGHHPHCHMVCWSDDPTEGFVTKHGIETMKSTLAREIFQQDLISV